MVNLRLNGVDVQVEEGQTLLEAARFYGIPIPTLCYHEGLSPYGACRLCVVEIGSDPQKSRLVTSCTYPAEEGLEVRTHSTRVIKARKMLVELLVAACPSSKTIQDLASQLGVTKVRFKPRNDDCILCGLCTRMCEEQMAAKAIGFVNRGVERKITTPFDIKSDVCRTCGACIYICPACQLRCQGPEPPTTLCSGCLNLSYPCLDLYEDAQCYMDPCAACLLKEAEEKKQKREVKTENENKEF